jgi:formamidopyrimidine-DNA glycosylase
MPELPEVETIVRRLREVVVGKKVNKIHVLRSKSFVGLPETLEGARITDITRRSKIIQFSFDRSEKLLIHLKMTGQLIYHDKNLRLGGGHPTADWVSELPSKHTRVVLDLGVGARTASVPASAKVHGSPENTARLFFNDLRVFGWLKIMDEAALAEEFSCLGPDIIDAQVTPTYFWEKFQKRAVPIKQLLMDNAVAAGIGNIYANDALHLAQISPFRAANSLSFAETERLYQAALSVIRSGIELGGATIDAYRHVDGFAGKYQTVVRTYGREGQPCLVCSTPIIRQKQGGRSTFYCPVCQK